MEYLIGGFILIVVLVMSYITFPYFINKIKKDERGVPIKYLDKLIELLRLFREDVIVNFNYDLGLLSGVQDYDEYIQLKEDLDEHGYRGVIQELCILHRGLYLDYIEMICILDDYVEYVDSLSEKEVDDIAKQKLFEKYVNLFNCVESLIKRVQDMMDENYRRESETYYGY